MNPGGCEKNESDRQHRQPAARLMLAAIALLLAIGVGDSSAERRADLVDEQTLFASNAADSKLAYTANDDRVVVRLYAAYFGREPDQSGFDYWRDRLITGGSGEQISDAFAASPEFVNRYGHLTDSEFVTLVYRNVLGRQAEVAGHAYWLGRLQAGELPGWTIEFEPYRAGYYGLTYPASQRIVIFVRSSQSEGHLAHVIAHEIGHAVDVSLNSGPERDLWNAERGINSTWWPGNGLTDFSSGAGDFAESFAYWQVGYRSGGVFHSTLAGRPDAGDLALLAELSQN